jgi:DNA-binding Lrp family transcriptional regulator
METDPLDLLDRKIAQALQIDGRAAFSSIAAALGVSDQTVARRYHRLRSTGILRVVGLPDPHRLRQIEWVIRLQCVPDAAASIAAALARRPDTSWVSLTSGGTEIICFARARSQRDAQLLGKLPATPRVVAITAHCLLHNFYGGVTGWRGRGDALSREQIRHLQPPEPHEPADQQPPSLDARDEALLAELARDGRTSYARLATATGWSVSTTQRRLEHLRQAGILYFDVDVDPEPLGFPTEAILWVTVPPAQLIQVGTTLATHPEVAFAAATTGPASLVAKIACRDIDALYQYVATQLGAIDAIHNLETAPVNQTVKRAGALLTT